MRYIIGIDEAGRGPLAGPVAVGVVMIPTDFDWSVLQGVRDSKQLRPQARERLFGEMRTLERAGHLRHAVCFSSSVYIDRFGIVPAISRALEGALDALQPDPAECMVLLDGGLRAPDRFKHQRTIIRGDQSEPAISLASIAAKVTRDKHMLELASKNPSWGFDVHKGYGTLDHRKIIAREGLSRYHRATFCTRLRVPPKSV